MITGFLKVSGMLILKIVYGKNFKSKIAASENGMTGIMILLSVVNIIWLMSLLFWISGIAAGDTVLCIIVSFAYPVAIIVWSVIARKSVGIKSADIEINAIKSSDVEDKS